MQPVLTPAEMAAVDAAALEPIDVLIDRAGRAVARVAFEMLGGSYGRVVRVIAGKGNNGNDGRVAAEVLRARGVHVQVVDAAAPPPTLAPADLIIDAAYGTGFRGSWTPPDVGATPVLAVDVPSGVDALEGSVSGAVLTADRTVTFHALKPGLLAGAGARLAGRVDVVDIGLDTRREIGRHASLATGSSGAESGGDPGVGTSATCHLVERSDVAAWWPTRDVDAHKWRGAVRVVAGSAGMTGAGVLCAEAAARSGAGLVELSAIDATTDVRAEIMQVPLDGDSDWSASVLDDLDRFGALAIGPGLGRASNTLDAVRSTIRVSSIPVVVDGDGISALSDDPAGVLAGRTGRAGPIVLTPHDGEYRHLTGALPGADRIAATRRLANEFGCTVLLKGPTTVVADPDGALLLVNHGDERLATAGAGDVLTGIIATALAGGLDPLRAAAAGAWVHAEAGHCQQRWGLLAGDLVEAVPRALAGLRSQQCSMDSTPR